MTTRLDSYFDHESGSDNEGEGNHGLPTATTDSNDNAKSNTNAGEGADTPGAKLKQREKTRKSFTANHLVNGIIGFKRVYEDFPEAFAARQRQQQGRDGRSGLLEGEEEGALARLVDMYRRWAFQLYPGLAFPDLLSAAETHGGKGPARAALADLRDRERNRFMRDVLHLDVTALQRPHTPPHLLSGSPGVEHHEQELLEQLEEEKEQEEEEAPLEAQPQDDRGKGGAKSSTPDTAFNSDDDDELLIEDEPSSATVATRGFAGASGLAARRGGAVIEDDEDDAEFE